MDKLPVDIVIDILTRLPVKSLMRCMCICKLWRNLAQDRQFIHRHLMNRSGQANPSVIFEGYREIYFLEHSETMNDYTYTEVKLPPIDFQDYAVIGSCYGLCLIRCKEFQKNICYIFNPITGSYLRLPDPEFGCDSQSQSQINVGFNSERNEYKVVALNRSSAEADTQSSEVFVHTVGGGGRWRGIGYVPYVINSQSALEVVFVYGALHWVCSSTATATATANNLIIVSFNIANEEFGVIPHPPEIASGEVVCFTLVVLDGCLWMVDVSSIDDHADLWMMKDYGVKESWTKCFSIKFHSRYISRALCFQKNGELLVLDTWNFLHSYNLGTMTWRVLNIEPWCPDNSKSLTHVGSLVSFPGCCRDLRVSEASSTPCCCCGYDNNPLAAVFE